MLNAGIIGCGKIAWQWDRSCARTYNTHAKAYATDQRVQLVACADTSVKNAKGLASRYKGVRPYVDYREMLTREPLDAVSVCTPPETHYRILKYLLTKTGVRYILAEKPLTTSLQRTEEIVRLAHKTHTHIMLNYIRRFDTTMRKVRDIIVHRRLGNFYFGRAMYYGGIKENAVHLLDLFGYFGFDLKEIKSVAKPTPLNGDRKESFIVYTSQGVPIAFQWFENKQYGYLEIDLFFEQGRVRIGDYCDVEMFKANDSRDYPGYRDLRLVKRYPSTLHTVMKYVVDDLVRHFKKQKVDYDFLTREVRLMKLIQRITP